MPEYRRFIAYFYEYIDGKKQRSAGFAKVELRGGVWRILFRLTTGGKLELPVNIYGFVRAKGYLLGLPMGTMRTGEEASQEWAYRAETPIRENYLVEDLAGIWVQSSDGRSFLTVWDEGEVDTGKFVLELPREPKNPAEGWGVRTRESESQKEADVQSRQEPGDQAEEDDPGSQRQAETAEAGSIEMQRQAEEDEPGSIEMQHQAGMAEQEAKEQEAQEEADGQSWREPELQAEGWGVREPELQAEEGERAREPELQAEEGERAREPEFQAEEGERAREPEFRTGEEGVRTGEPEEQTEAAESGSIEMQCQAETAEPDSIELQRPAGKDKRSPWEAEEREKSEPEFQMEKDRQEKSEPEPQMEKDCQAEHEQKAGTKQDIQELFRFRPRCQPFQDGEITGCVMLRPCDIVWLQQRGWQVGRSSFLQHGFYQYRHLLLGIARDNTFVIGVPGLYNPQEKYMAGMFGFEKFKQAGNRRNNAVFGYWYRTLERRI